MVHHLEFEKSVLELEGKIAELRHASNDKGVDMGDEIKRLQDKTDKILKQTYEKLAPKEKVQVSRHPERPHFSDYIKGFITNFIPLAGDRTFGEDEALIGGLGRFRGQSCVIMGQEKGNDTESRIRHNFGMVRPEGYRKAQRLMKLADKFRLPIITLVDTAGAYPGVGAEERGQSEAIAKSIEQCLRMHVPIISIIIGEGGSGGAIAIATANRVYMLEHSIYSVISPEGCASILWKSADYAKDAAKALKLTAEDLSGFGIIDGIIPEPVGGAHRDHATTINSVADQISKALDEFKGMGGETIKARRRQKFLEIGNNL